MEVALTFDDGPGPFTESVLEVLERHKISATFFVIGRSVDSAGGHEQLVKMLRAGHQVGNHSYSHSSQQAPPWEERLKEEISRVDAIIHKARVAADSRVAEVIPVRLPYGTQGPSDWRVGTVARTGRMPLDWNVCPEDWRRQKAGDGEEMAKDMIRLIEDHNLGADRRIVLLHDACAESATESRQETVTAVDCLLAEASKEWRFVTLS
jgi:peptidoglycan/xylan/chitin deacetylase (PgdA/CDA1 family)